jgi:Right handed beta helix region
MMRIASRRSAFWVVASAAIAGGAYALAAGDDGTTVVLRPGQNIQAIVARSPEGTRFRLEPGIYRQQTIHPKNGQKFVGRDGAILSGAMELTTWTKDSGFWRAEGLPLPLPFHGECSDGRDLCKLREDLFVDDRLFKRVESLDELGPGRWYYADGRAYLADDPTGQSVELGVAPLAFGGEAQGVVLRNLIVEKYASDAQEGAIYADDARGWRLSNVTARWNHGAGLSFGPETRVQGGSFSHNGQLGIAGSGGEGSRIQGVEIAFNNYAGYNARWEAGGTKFWATKGLVVRNSCIHHNAGPGLWTDNDNIDTVFENNIVFNNANEGIKHEISYDAIIRNNFVARNGTSGIDTWLWGSQILIQDSSNVEVYGNLVETAGTFGNGIGVIYQDRGSGALGPWQAVNNSVHHNTIVHRGGRGRNGIVTDTGDDQFWREAGNRFDSNTYLVADETFAHWDFTDLKTWDDIKGLGFEENGELRIGRPAARKLSCDR